MKHFTRRENRHTPLSPWKRFRALPSAARWAGIGLLVLAVIFTAWLGLGAYQAKSNLEQTRSSAEQSKDALLSGNSEDATRLAQSAQFHARQARAATHSLPWNVAAAIPLLGSPLKTTQQISDVVVSLADEVLLPTANVGVAVSPDKLINGTRLDLNLLRQELPRLNELSAAADRLDAQAQAITSPAYLGLIKDARAQLQAQISYLARLLGNTAIAAKLAPSMLGADGPRTYLMAFQTPAEARGTGGLVGAVALLKFADGLPTVDTVRANYTFLEATADIDLGPEFTRVYGWTNPLADFRNSNLSPHFPYAARIWKSMWERKVAGGGPGAPVDGVVAVDPVALSYVLGAIGPVTLPDGEVVSEENVVELTMSTAYSRFATGADEDANQIARKAYLLEIATATVKKLAGPLPAPRKLLDALGRAAGEGRISVWSNSPADQILLEETPLAHTVSEADVPYAQVVLNNLAGNKMDFYLEREIEYAADGCDNEMRNSTVTVRLTNTAPPDIPLPEYVGGTLGLLAGPLVEAPEGTMFSSVKLIATKGARLMSVTSNGKRINAIPQTELGHPSFEIQLAIPRGKTSELIFRLSEPVLAGAPEVPIQPLIDDVTPLLSVPECSG